MFSSKKWPLIVLHNRRVTGTKLDKPIHQELVERWRNADALYATPTGSNDDWWVSLLVLVRIARVYMQYIFGYVNNWFFRYWLYAAIKFKCLLVTNDEMRDHTFQLLGTDFFPKWKERHQVSKIFANSKRSCLIKTAIILLWDLRMPEWLNYWCITLCSDLEKSQKLPVFSLKVG